MHPTGFITMYTARHEHDWKRVTPIAALQREQRIVLRWIMELTVSHHIESRTEPVDCIQYVIGVAALLALARQPFGLFRVAPGLTRSADGIFLRHLRHPHSAWETVGASITRIRAPDHSALFNPRNRVTLSFR